ncbi:DUF6036 family nucleotidyltransferase [Baekduia sp. Peel2402]|uniref:DUF6036 family nucleotidyltransferase n=1 Tax=Baekduia sp. Peel2402 TaxID=3458296 RepID=UPI00403E4BE3
MRRQDFEHVIAAAANVTGLDDLVVIGSQAILGTHDEVPSEMRESLEADLYPRDDPQRADMIDGALGDGSSFQVTFGYYAHGVGPETAKAPEGWEGRLVPVPVPARVASDRRPVAWCLEPHDLVLSKCAAGRPRDWDYAQAALRAGIVRLDVLLERTPDLPIPQVGREHVEKMLRALGTTDA